MQPIRQNVGRDPFFGLRQQLTEMPAIADQNVADDDKAPPVAEHFQSEIDRAAGPMWLNHSQSPHWKLIDKTDPIMQVVLKCNQFEARRRCCWRARLPLYTVAVERLAARPRGHSLAKEQGSSSLERRSPSFKRSLRTLSGKEALSTSLKSMRWMRPR